MTGTCATKSRMAQKGHVRFGSGGEEGDLFPDHNLGGAVGLLHNHRQEYSGDIL